MSGNFGYDPLKSGAEKGRNVELILHSLLEAGGDVLATDISSYRWAQLNAEARCIAYLWSLNKRFANQWDAARMTDFLPRWERIMQITPPRNASDVERRARVGAKSSIWGKPPTFQVLDDLLNTVAPSIYVGIINYSSAVATSQLPGGVTVPGGVTLPDGPWYSTIAYIAFQTAKPASMLEYDYYELRASLRAYLESILPAWCTYDLFRDGPGGDGFFLDVPANIDNMRFR